MEENPYKAPNEPRRIAQRAAVALFGSGIAGMILSLGGNEKHVFSLFIMLMAMAVGFAIEAWRYPK